jgi:hypothetical protein
MKNPAARSTGALDDWCGVRRIRHIHRVLEETEGCGRLLSTAPPHVAITPAHAHAAPFPPQISDRESADGRRRLGTRSGGADVVLGRAVSADMF